MAKAKVIQMRDCTIRGTPKMVRALLDELTDIETQGTIVLQMKDVLVNMRPGPNPGARKDGSRSSTGG